MSALEELSRAVITEVTLQQRLLATTTRDEFVELATLIARERGMSLTPAEVESALDERRRARLERWV
jgi:hypothetical protein